MLSIVTSQGEEKGGEKTETKTHLSNLLDRNLGSMDLDFDV